MKMDHFALCWQDFDSSGQSPKFDKSVDYVFITVDVRKEDANTYLNYTATVINASN